VMAMKTYSLLLEGLPDDFGCVRSKLDLYFKNKRKSGGEVLEIRHHPEDRRAAVLVYLEEEVKNKVLERGTHRVDLKTWGTVELRVKPLPETEQVYCTIHKHITEVKHDHDSKHKDLEKVLARKEHAVSHTTVRAELYDEEAEERRLDPRRFVLRGFGETCPAGFVSVYLNSCSKSAAHSWELLPDGIAVTFHGGLDVKSFLKKCFTKHLQGNAITVTRLEVTDSVLVRGQMSAITEDTLQLYFSNPKRSKGGKIKSLRWCTKGESIIIAFEVAQDAQRVSEQPHVLCGVKMTAHLYYSSLGQALTGQTPPLPNLPSKITIPMDRQLLDYITSRAKCTEEFEKALGEVYAKVHFEGSPQPDRVVVEITAESNSLLLHRLAPSWERNARQTVHSLLDKYRIIQLKTETAVWEKIKTKCLSCISPDLNVHFESTTSSVVVLGLQEEVQSLQRKVELLMKEAGAELEVERNTVESRVMGDSEEELDFLCNLVFPKLVDIKLSKDQSALALCLKGHRDKVKQAESLVSETRQKLVAQTLNLSACQTEFLKSLDVKEFVRDHFARNGISATVLSHRSFQVLAEKKDIKRAVEKVQESVTEEIIRLTSDQAQVAKTEKWEQFLGELKAEVTAAAEHIRGAVAAVRKQIAVVVSAKHVYGGAGESRALAKHEDSLRARAKELGCALWLSVQPASKPSSGPPCGVRIGGVVDLSVRQGAVAGQQADALVCPVNGSLAFDNPVARELLAAGGPRVKDPCDDLLKTRQALRAGEVVPSSPGNLPSKVLLLAVLPVWGKCNCAGVGGQPLESAFLHTAVLRCLQLAEERRCSSVALPALGCGGFGFPAAESARVVMGAVLAFCDREREAARHLRSVMVVESDIRNVEEFQSVAKAMVGAVVYTQTEQHKVQDYTQSDSSYYFISGVFRAEGVTVTLQKGDITRETVDVIVNSTNSSLDLNTGKITGVSGAILKAAGKKTNLPVALGAQPADGVVSTAAGQLRCRHIVHMVGPTTAAGIAASVESAAQECERRSAASVSFPAVGTGRGGIGHKESIEAMLKGLEQHFSKTGSTSIKSVRVIAFEQPVYDSFRDYFAQRGPQSPSAGAQSLSTQLSASQGHLNVTSTQFPSQVKVCNVTVEVKKGDITCESVRGIVNSTNKELNLMGGVSAAILKAAGQSVVDECTALGTLPSDGFAFTGAGKLPAKHIVHMVGQTTESAITVSMCKVLKACEAKKIQSVSFPALGTGAGNLGAAQVASAMIDAVGLFALEHYKPSLNVIRLVIFQPGMMPEFEQVMKRFKKVTPQPKQHAHVNPSLRKAPAIVPHTSLGSLAELVTHPVATVEVCGASRQALAQVKRCLDELLAGECSSQEVDATHLDSLLEQEKQEIASLSRRHEVRLEVGAGKLTVTGKTDDVLTAVLEISGFFQKAKERENAAQDRERMKNIVRWEVVKSGTTTALDAHINYELELAYHKEKRHVYRSNAETFTVDFVSMQQTDSKGNVLKIKRTTLTDSETAIIELPVTWTDMKGKDMEIIMLSAKSEEFCKISKEFVISSKAAVQKIERIQNREQWQRYAVRKQAVDRKYPTQANERILYHGTTQDICQKINRTGFNRSFCGRNATKFGQGTYFAKEAYYSCDDTYSNPDEQGYKYIYRARVLTGKLCQGHEDMKEPAPVNAGDPCSDLCDCAVDKMASPFIFVIFCDFGAYPEYLITFKVV
uniref:Poly [ADP-ribose] polymerase n=1 Tax=Lepisosteus oculatus TaxID=7918 RepID=W5M0F0_LEPOC